MEQTFSIDYVIGLMVNLCPDAYKLYLTGNRVYLTSRDDIDYMNIRGDVLLFTLPDSCHYLFCNVSFTFRYWDIIYEFGVYKIKLYFWEPDSVVPFKSFSHV